MKKIGFVCAGANEEIEKSNGLILKTINGGKTWKEVYKSKRPYELMWEMYIPSPKIGYATLQSYNPDTTMQQQRIEKTSNGGKTWKEINWVKDTKARQFGIGFINESHGFVGTMNTGFETKDCGKS